MRLQISPFFILTLTLLVNLTSYAEEIHCPRANTIHPITAGDNPLYSSSDGLFEPWWGSFDGKQIQNLSFDRVEFYYSDSSKQYLFSNCYYHADGKVLKMIPFDGFHISIYFEISPKENQFIKDGTRAFCTKSELACAFNYKV